MPAHGGLDRDLIRRLHADELARFRGARPRSLALLERARASLPNGVPKTPTPISATDADVARYAGAYRELLAALAR